MLGKLVFELVNLLIRVCKCLGRIGSFFVVEIDLVENFL